jgi:hypothetical protein
MFQFCGRVRLTGDALFGTLCATKKIRYFERHRLGIIAQMPQINFGRAFTVPEQDQLPGSASAEPRYSDFSCKTEIEDKPKNFTTNTRLGRDHWVNIIFVTITLVGGLFWAVYFFNGADLWRVAAAWPRVLLHLRPPGLTATVESNQAGESLLIPSQAADHSGDPFARSSGFLTLGSPAIVGSFGVGAGLPTTALLATRRSTFAQLGFAVPGGDALTQAFDRGVAELARADNREVSPPSIMIRPPGSKIHKATSGKPESSAKRPGHGGKSATQEMPAVATAITTSRETTNSARNFPSNTAQPMLNSTDSASSGIGSAPGRSPASVGNYH